MQLILLCVFAFFLFEQSPDALQILGRVYGDIVVVRHLDANRYSVLEGPKLFEFLQLLERRRLGPGELEKYRFRINIETDVLVETSVARRRSLSKRTRESFRGLMSFVATKGMGHREK